MLWYSQVWKTVCSGGCHRKPTLRGKTQAQSYIKPPMPHCSMNIQALHFYIWSLNNNPSWFVSTPIPQQICKFSLLPHLTFSTTQSYTQDLSIIYLLKIRFQIGLQTIFYCLKVFLIISFVWLYNFSTLAWVYMLEILSKNCECTVLRQHNIRQRTTFHSTWLSYALT